MFLTRLPVPAWVDHHPAYLMRSMMWFPLIGELGSACCQGARHWGCIGPAGRLVAFASAHRLGGLAPGMPGYVVNAT